MSNTDNKDAAQRKGELSDQQLDGVAGGQEVRKMGTIDGLLVGNRTMFERMCAAISMTKLKPVIDRSFAFDDAKAAYEYQASPDLFGKVVITI